MNAPTLKTERLILRPFWDADAPLLADGVYADPDAFANLPGDPETPAERLECAWKDIRSYSDPWEPHGWGGWAVTLRGPDLGSPGAFLGFCGFEAGQIEGAGPELGYAIAQPFWGKGLVSEAAIRAVDWFFDEAGHEACYACHAPGNAASGRILEKAGFTRREDRDLWNSVARGLGLVPFYTVSRMEHTARRGGA